MGAGSGGVLAVLQAAPYNVIGVGLTMSMDNAPHLEVMGARGLIGLRWSLAKALPFADGAFDLLHARLSGLGSAGAQAGDAARAVEHDRLGALRVGPRRAAGRLPGADRLARVVAGHDDGGHRLRQGGRRGDEGQVWRARRRRGRAAARADLPLRTERKTSQRLAREAGAQNGAEAEAWAREYLGFIQVTIDHVRAVANAG